MSREDNLQPAPRWKPGQSGNPAGKVPGTRSITTHLKELLEKKIDGPKSPLTPDGGKMSAAQLVALKLISQALKGDMRAIMQIQDRVECKSIQGIELEDKTPQSTMASRADVFKKLDQLEKTIKSQSATQNRANRSS